MREKQLLNGYISSWTAAFFQLRGGDGDLAGGLEWRMENGECRRAWA